ncbi:MAG TPA: HPr family phosphocarrier protein [Pyrinomonadaceae bacterium]|nr:HPr family phosphocarrier protein [Pyrinomonadaceae bacterium]
MLEGTVKVINPLGLHARAAAQLVRLAGQYASSIILRRSDSGTTANAKSILSVLALAASMGTTVEVTADGSDEQDAFNAIEKLFAEGFGEI